jgi:hypothetical protein
MSSSSSTSDRRRKARNEAIVHSNNQVRKQSKDSQPRTRASGLSVAPLMHDATERTSGANDEPTMYDAAATEGASTAASEDEEKVLVVGKLIQSLLHSDKNKRDASLEALQLNLGTDQNKKEHIQNVGGCHVLVQLMQNCLDKAVSENTKEECDQLTELSELDELETLEGVLDIIANLTYQHGGSRIGITAIGGVGVVVNVMTTFPACHGLQLQAAGVLKNLGCCDSGEKEAVKSGAIEVLLVAVNNHGNSPSLIKEAFDTLHSMIAKSKYNTKVFNRCGGSATVAKVAEMREYWLNGEVKMCVLALTAVMVEDMKTWMQGDEERD